MPYTLAMQSGASRISWLDLFWLVVCGVVSSAFIVSAASRLSATFDEPLYLQLGLTHWRTGSTHGLMRVGTMPLPVDAITLPVYAWELIRGQPFDPKLDIDRILPVARAGTLPFWWMLLVLGWRMARELGGPWAGRLAVTFLACEPNLLAHAGLATTDVALTACLMLFTWIFAQNREGGWWRRVAWPALAYAVAMLAKASALAYVPLCALTLEACRLWSSTGAGGFWPRMRGVFFRLNTRRNWCDAVQASAIALAVVYTYCGSDWQPEPSFVAWAKSLPDGRFADAMRWSSEHLCVFNNAGVAFARQIKHNMQGHGVYVLGETAPRSIWYYYPAALSIKSPLALLAAPVVVLALRPRAAFNWATATALVLLAFSLNCRVQIGVRLVLPIVVFAIIGVAAGFSRIIDSGESLWRRRIAMAVATMSAAWVGLASAGNWPNGLCYVNEAWGGSSNAHRLLSDSNCDWGQGLHELSAWMRRERCDNLCVWYFGADPRIDRPPFVHLPLHREPVQNADELCRRLNGRRFAIGKTLLYGGYKINPQQRELLSWLRQQRPAAQTSTFLIYDFREKNLAAK